MQAERLLLVLDDTTGTKPDQRVRDDLSAVARIENTLWLGCDEGAYLERLPRRTIIPTEITNASLWTAF